MQDKVEAGFRLNVGMVILNADNQVFWACRSDFADAWQFPQGGIQIGESPVEAMYRELTEEVGLQSSDVQLIAELQQWLSYRLPENKQKIEGENFLGQKQKWFLLRLTSDESQIGLDRSAVQEFSRWCWVDYWYPVQHVVEFKRKVYQQCLTEFEQLI